MDNNQPKKILVVDDEPDILTLITARLEQKGYLVIAASDGLEGFEKAEKNRPDLILVDISMPRMNGFQMIELLHQYDTLSGIPVVVITASRQKDEEAWCKQAGIAQFILKPFEAEELLEKIRKALYSPPPREKSGRAS